MSAGTDVLAVMERAVCGYATFAELRTARDAVAELMDAAKDITPVLNKSTPLLNAYRKEIETFRAALAKVQQP